MRSFPAVAEPDTPFIHDEGHEPPRTPQSTPSLDALYRQHAAWLTGLLRLRYGRDAAEDLVQETFLRAANAGTADTIRHPRAWLFRIAVNAARDRHRRAATRLPSAGGSPDLPFPRLPAHADQAEALLLKQVVLSLPLHLRDVFLLSRFGGLSYDEIAKRRGISVKGVGVVIPNLLTWPGSVVVLDVKRENWDATAGFRAAHGQGVFLFDPLEPEGRTARFNPLAHIDRTDPLQVLDELQRIAVMLLPTPTHTDPFWAEAARTGLIGLGAYVAATPALPFTLGTIYAELAAGDPRTRLPKLIAARARAGQPLSPGCMQALTDFCSSSENTFASVRQTLTSRLSLWLNPRVCAATEASDFDLRTLRSRRQSIYLGASPDNLARVAPLYALLFQQLIDLSTRERPAPGRHQIPVLLLLDEFARLGHASVLAHAFAYVAGYGLRLLPVLQSPAQLRHEYGPDLAQEIVANCGVEVIFAPKELHVANDLSERLGFTTVRSPSRSRPSGLARGHRSVSESDQRRALMLSQELMQLPADALVVLKAGMPPARGRKIVFYRERAFTRRLTPPPVLSPRRLAPAAEIATDAEISPCGHAAGGPDPLTLAWIAPALDAAGLEPLPPEGATPEAVEAWVERFIDSSANLQHREARHGR